MTGCDVFRKPSGMLKRVHDEKCKVKSHEYRVSGYESRFWPESCQNDEKDCHPELVSGSGFLKTLSGVVGCGLERTKDQLQVVSCMCE